MAELLRVKTPKKNPKKGIAAKDHATKRAEAEVRQEAYAKIPLTERLKTAGKKEAAKIRAKLAQAGNRAGQ